MNIQDTINELQLESVELPRILNQRVKTIIDLQKKVELAQKEVESDDNDENKAKLEEINDYLNEYFTDAVEQLKSFAKKHTEKMKKEAELKEKEKEAELKEEEKEAKVKDEVKSKTEQKEATEKQTESVEAEPQKEKSNGGLGALLIGGVILVATLGAVNIMRNR